MTAPAPKTRTVLVDSEKGSRLLLPSMVRAPFTVTGTSTATACCLGADSAEATGAEAERDTVSGIAVEVSDSLMIGGMARTPAKQDFCCWPCPGFPQRPTFISSPSTERASHSTRVLPWKHLFARTGPNFAGARMGRGRGGKKLAAGEEIFPAIAEGEVGTVRRLQLGSR